MGRRIFQDGKVFHETSTGSFHPETTLLGNPKMQLDFWGNPKIKTDFWGNQIVERDFLGNPLIPVEYPTRSALGGKANASNVEFGGGFEVFLQLLPYILVGGGLVSVFATLAGLTIFLISIIGISVTALAAWFCDSFGKKSISKGMHRAFYLLSVAWTCALTTFWIYFFFNMNFDVAAVNYLTQDDLMQLIFSRMVLNALVGVMLASLLTFWFRSDMYAVRKSLRNGRNRDCCKDMLTAFIAPPILAVFTSLVWTLVVAPLIAIFAHQPWRSVADRQDTVMAVVFVCLAIFVVAKRSLMMIKGK